MIDYDSNLSAPQIRDLLEHVVSLHFNLAQSKNDMVGIKLGSDESWAFFKSLDLPARFQIVSSILNELNFKATLYSMLNTIKFSSHRVTNGNFLCLHSHLLNLLSSSVQSQDLKNGKSESAKPTEHIKIVRFDENVLWNPAQSEWLLQNITLPCPMAAKFATAQSSSTRASDMIFAASTGLVCDVDSLRREVAAVIFDQTRQLTVTRTSAEEVERAKSQPHAHTPEFAEGSGSGITAPTTHSPFTTAIASTSLAAVLALQLSYGIEGAYQRHIRSLSTMGLPSVEDSSGVSRSGPSLFRFLCGSVPVGQHSALSTHATSQMFSAAFLDAMWRDSSTTQRLALLTQVGLTLTTSPPPSGGSSSGVGKVTKKKHSSSSSTLSVEQHHQLLEVTVEQLQAEFRNFVVNCTPPRSTAPFNCWEEEESLALQQSQPLLTGEGGGEDEWVDLEGGVKGLTDTEFAREDYDDPRLVLQHRQQHLLRAQEQFLLWCVSQESLGCILCEYVTLCPVFKLFSSLPPHTTHVPRKVCAEDNYIFNWLQWAMAAYSSLEAQWVELEAERLCVALDDVSNSGEVKESPRATDAVSNVSKSSTGKKKTKKSSKKNAAKAVAASSSVDTYTENTGGSGNGSGYAEELQSILTASASVSGEEETVVYVSSEVELREKCGDGSNVLATSVPVETAVSSTYGNTVVIDEVKSDVESSPEADYHHNLSKESSLYTVKQNEDTSESVPAFGEDHGERSIAELHMEVCGACHENMGGGDVDEDASVVVCAEVEVGAEEVEGNTSEEGTQYSDSDPRVTSGRLSLPLSQPSSNSSPLSRPVSGGHIEGTSSPRHSRDKAEITLLTASSPLQSRNPTVKSHKGDFLRSECEGKESSDRPSTDSASRVDLIRWDQQRNLADRLTDDILSMAASLHRIANMRRPWQMAAVERVRVVVHSLWPQAHCDIFGSFGTGLAIPSSDVDIVVSGVGIAHQLHWWGGKAVTAIAALTHHLQQRDWVSTIRAIEHTAMPVIKLTTASVPMPPLQGGGGERKDFRGVIKIDISICSVPSQQQQQIQVPSQHMPVYVYEDHSAPTIPLQFVHSQQPFQQQQQPLMQTFQPQRTLSQRSPPGTMSPMVTASSAGDHQPARFLPAPPPSMSARPLAFPNQHTPSFAPSFQSLPPTSSGSPPPHQGVSTRDFVLRLCSLNPSLVPLVLVLKQFLQEKGLHDPFTGGLSSYALTIMVAAILQPHALERPETQPDLGTLLLTFLRRYGTRFDTRKYAVVLSINGPFASLAPGGANAAHVPRVGTPGYWLPADPVVVSDPLNSQNNLGRSCFGFRQLQQEFDNALDRVMACCVQDPSFSDTSDTRSRSVLGAVFGTVHHDSVVRLQSQVWCPQENRFGNGPSNSSLSSCSSQVSGEARPSDETVMGRDSGEQPQPQSQPQQVQVKGSAVGRGEAQLRDECLLLLQDMTEAQLLRAVESLRIIVSGPNPK